MTALNNKHKKIKKSIHNKTTKIKKAHTIFQQKLFILKELTSLFFQNLIKMLRILKIWILTSKQTETEGFKNSL